MGALFTLTELNRAASDLLEVQPGSVVKWRLLREVLRFPLDDPQLRETKKALEFDPWVRQLEHAQLADGSWGRFHTQNTRQKTVFRTTEEAIDRAFALGLEPAEGPLASVRRYILEILRGNAHITDRDEKHAAWPLGIRLILTGRLAQIDPGNAMLDSLWSYGLEVAQQSFASGTYRREDEVAAYRRLSGIHWPQGFLDSQHVLWILSAHELPLQLDRELVHWIWHKPDGIRYLSTPVYELDPRRVGTWLRSMGIVSRFRCWKEFSLDILNRLWEWRDSHGLWDFGSHIARTIDFPLSRDWRTSGNCRADYSVCILALLRRYFDPL